ncbi:hypothetical protein KIPB_012967, partial [Kipferlia bialata]
GFYAKVLDHLKDCYNMFRYDGAPTQAEWAKFVSSVDTSFEEGLRSMLVRSLQELTVLLGGSPGQRAGDNQNDVGADIVPSFRLAVKLTKQGVTLVPSIKRLGTSTDAAVKGLLLMLTGVDRFSLTLKKTESITRQAQVDKRRDEFAARQEQR